MNATQNREGRFGAPGFTLLEILLSVAILAVVTTVTYTTFSTVTMAWRRGLDLSEKLHHGDFVVEQIVMALRSAYYPSEGGGEPYGFRLEEKGEGAGNSDVLSWVKVGTALVGEDNPSAGGPHRVRIWLKENEEGVPALAVTSWHVLEEVDDFDPEQLEPSFLAGRIIGLNCRCQDPESDNEDEIEWIDDWEDTNRVPLSVELTVYMDPLAEREDPVEVKRVVEIPVAPVIVAERREGVEMKSASRLLAAPNPSRLPPPIDRGRPDAAGSALVVVLWVIGLLSLLVASFAFDAHIEARITSYYRKRSKANHLALSGVEIAKLLMAKTATIDPRSDEEPEEDDRWFEDARRLVRGNTVSLEEEIGEGVVHIEIASEQARRNVNLLKREDEWEPILDVGDVPEEYWPELIESFLDWVDADDVSRADGAESDDYYETLDPPYRAQNGAVFTVDDLLRIKGFTRAIVYGGVLDAEDEEPVIISGIADLLTTFGDAKVNVNAASRRVLLTLPDPDGEADLVADDILLEREGTENADGDLEPEFFTGNADMFSRIPSLGVAPRKDYVTTSGSRFYRITSVGEVSGIKRKVWCIVQTAGNDKFRILRWREEG